ncbi:hypothetical protein M569_16373, partial [Genlisea aurea]
MGKSGGRRKKSAVVPSQGQDQAAAAVAAATVSSASVVNGSPALDSSILLKRAHELKEEGNRRFQAKDYGAALQQYENALKLTPKTHPDRAIFHSNRAACLMQMKPIDYEAVISECSSSLLVQPSYVRALLRRARAYEAIGKHEMAMQDVQLLLASDPNNGDALEIAGRLRTALGPRQEAQQDLQSRPSPAALGASAVGAPISGLGPCLPARTVPKKAAPLPLHSPRSDKMTMHQTPPVENGSPSSSQIKAQMPKVLLKPSRSSSDSSKDKQNEKSAGPAPEKAAVLQYRQLKLVYDHDIRLAQMPVKCSFRVLRDVVSQRLPMSKAVLIKYRDGDGDLVTITSSAELRLAESSVENGPLKLHIVEVSPEQEPPASSSEDEEEKHLENISRPTTADSAAEAVHPEMERILPQQKPADDDPEFKEVEMDDWLFDFAQLFRSHVGIDPDAHIDLHELGMELCSEALEETVTAEAAQPLFERAALKFQEVAALALFNWGNVHMCAARKKIPIEESSSDGQLRKAYDFVKDKYSRAREKYEESLSIKPDFYEGLLALGQQQFEMGKLHWSFVLAKKDDVSKWDPSETLALFDSAEEKMRSATAMWEAATEEKKRTADEEELLPRRKQRSPSSDPPAEDAAVMRSQIQLFWGNMLFERSQMECRLGLSGWKRNLDVAAEQFRLAGASESDIETVMKNHFSNQQ